MDSDDLILSNKKKYKRQKSYQVNNESLMQNTNKYLQREINF